LQVLFEISGKAFAIFSPFHRFFPTPSHPFQLHNTTIFQIHHPPFTINQPSTISPFQITQTTITMNPCLSESPFSNLYPIQIHHHNHQITQAAQAVHHLLSPFPSFNSIHLTTQAITGSPVHHHIFITITKSPTCDHGSITCNHNHRYFSISQTTINNSHSSNQIHQETTPQSSPLLHTIQDQKSWISVVDSAPIPPSQTP
jgi:hypothetical protein